MYPPARSGGQKVARRTASLSLESWIPKCKQRQLILGTTTTIHQICYVNVRQFFLFVLGLADFIQHNPRFSVFGRPFATTGPRQTLKLITVVCPLGSNPLKVGRQITKRHCIDLALSIETVEDTKNSFVKRDPNALPPAPRDFGPNHSRQSSKNIFTPLLEPDPALLPATDKGEEQGGSSTETQRGKLAVYRPPKTISHEHDTFLTPRKRRATVTNIFSTEASDVVAQTGETRRAKSSMQLISNITPMERQTPPSSRRGGQPWILC